MQGRADSIGRPLEPVRAAGRLLGGKDVDETAGEFVEAVGLHDVAVEARRQKLGEDKDALDARVDAVRDRDVDDPVLPRETDGRLGPAEREGVEPRPAAPAQDDGGHRFHARTGGFAPFRVAGRIKGGHLSSVRARCDRQTG